MSHARALIFAFAASVCLSVAHAECPVWPDWERFRALYVSDDGRVIDASTPNHVTVSEGQAYALFFALVSNDHGTFDRLLRWTENNLANGDLDRHLPAWIWGRDQDGEWRVLDVNPASDADLWIAYSLFEAARLWRSPEYAARGRSLAERILREEVTTIPGLGPTLLPAPRGFVSNQTWRLNASYVPVQLMRAMRHHTRDVTWSSMISSSQRVIIGSSPKGFSGDWIEYRTGTGFTPDRETKGIGSYNAIRVYLWAGMLADRDPLKSQLAGALQPMVALTARSEAPPESARIDSGEVSGRGSPGFSASLLPLLKYSSESEALTSHTQRVRTQALQNNQAYYSDVLSLFGLGWLDGRYAFDKTGLLKVNWKATCAPAH